MLCFPEVNKKENELANALKQMDMKDLEISKLREKIQHLKVFMNICMSFSLITTLWHLYDIITNIFRHNDCLLEKLAGELSSGPSHVYVYY